MILVSNVIDSIPERHRDTFVQVLEERDSELLKQLRGQKKPTLAQADSVTTLFARAFIVNIGPNDDYPTELAVRIDDALRVFLARWPGETLEDS
ncbi:MAG: hypothetical protein ACRDRL_15680 [Sciscionella sp.]